MPKVLQLIPLSQVQAESDDDVTQFRGGKKICHKECVLISTPRLE